MKNILKIAFLLIITFSNAQQKLTLEECYNLVDKNYPLAKQSQLLDQKSSFETDALQKAKLPKVDVNAQATYQSMRLALPYCAIRRSSIRLLQASAALPPRPFSIPLRRRALPAQRPQPSRMQKSARSWL